MFCLMPQFNLPQVTTLRAQKSEHKLGFASDESCRVLLGALRAYADAS